MKSKLRIGLMLGIFAFASSIFAITPVVHATWHTQQYYCPNLSPGNYCYTNEDSALQLLTHVDSTSPSTYICAGYYITSGTNSGRAYCTVVYGSGSGNTFNNDGTQTVESWYFDCTSAVCGYQGATTNMYYTDSAFINSPPP